MYKYYFVLRLKDNTTIDFERRCNYLKESMSGKMISFFHTERGNEQLLFMISIDSILYISTCIDD